MQPRFNALIRYLVCGLPALMLALTFSDAAEAGMMLPAEVGPTEVSGLVSQAASGSAESERRPDSDSLQKLFVVDLLGHQSDSGNGGTGVGTGSAGPTAAIIAAIDSKTRTGLLVGFRVEFVSSLLPAPPAFDLLRPPKTRV